MQDATDFEALLRALAGADVEFIVVGGLAGTVHGAAFVTWDLDIVYRRSGTNIQKLVAALAPYDPYLRGAPRGLPFAWTADTVAAGLNFTLETRAGNIDLLGGIVGGPDFEHLLPHSELREAFGTTFRCVSLPKLILLKRSAGRPKDLDAIAQLEALLEEKQKLSGVQGTPPSKQ